MSSPRRSLALATTATLVLALASAQAQSTSPVIDTIEEDWQLVVAAPDVPGVGPQITTVMSPTGNMSDPFVAFDLNYREYPNFTAGGLQVQVWSSNAVTATASQGSAQFQTANETVTWTQNMSLSAGSITYSISNGHSTTWGSFGQGALLTVSYATPITSLGAYTPAASAADSGVSWESNRVTSMTLVQVRYYAAGVLVSTDTTARSITLN
jgi:hypothetical protein